VSNPVCVIVAISQTRMFAIYGSLLCSLRTWETTDAILVLDTGRHVAQWLARQSPMLAELVGCGFDSILLRTFFV
jgi:hypothetical protein